MKWTISRKLGAVFGVLVLFSAVSSIFSMYTFGNFTATVAANLGGRSSRERLATEWAALVNLNGARTIAILKSDGAGMKLAFSGDLERTSKRITEIQKELEKTDSSAEARRLLGEIGTRREAYTTSRKKALQAKSDLVDAELNRKVDEVVCPPWPPMWRASRSSPPTTRRHSTVWSLGLNRRQVIRGTSF
jgi:methyl-accepting chemotaxis protein